MRDEKKNKADGTWGVQKTKKRVKKPQGGDRLAWGRVNDERTTWKWGLHGIDKKVNTNYGGGGGDKGKRGFCANKVLFKTMGFQPKGKRRLWGGGENCPKSTPKWQASFLNQKVGDNRKKKPRGGGGWAEGGPKHGEIS